MDEYELDLDVLARPALIVKLDNQPIEIYPPEVEQLIGIQKLYKELRLGEGAKKESKDLSPDEVIETSERLSKVLTELRTLLAQIAPKTEGKRLNMRQLMAVFTAVIKQSMPKEVEELKKKGITFNSDTKKKQDLDTPEKSEDSSTSTQDTQSAVS